MTTSASARPDGRRAALQEIALVVLVMVVIVAAGWRMVGDDIIARQAVAWVANVAVLAALALGLRRRGESWRSYGLGFRFGGYRALLRTVAQSIVIFVLALVAFVVAGMVLAKLVTGGPGAPAADMSGYDYLRGNLPLLLAALACVYVASSFGEETIYRGFLIRRCEDLAGSHRWARPLAVAMSALVFGAAHFSWGVVGMVQTACMGLVLAVAYLRTGRNLWALVLAHAYIDTLLMVQMYAASPPSAALN